MSRIAIKFCSKHNATYTGTRCPLCTRAAYVRIERERYDAMVGALVTAEAELVRRYANQIWREGGTAEAAIAAVNEAPPLPLAAVRAALAEEGKVP